MQRDRQPRELAERPLSHGNPYRVEAAYVRSDLLDRRRQLMEEWSNFFVAESDKDSAGKDSHGLTSHAANTKV